MKTLTYIERSPWTGQLYWCLDYWLRFSPEEITTITSKDQSAFAEVNRVHEFYAATGEEAEYARCLKFLDWHEADVRLKRDLGFFIGPDGEWHMMHPLLEAASALVEECLQPRVRF